jgi:hypothetical protein
VYRLLGERYLPLIALTDSCAHPVRLSPPSAIRPRSWSLCRLSSVPAVGRMFPTLSLRTFPQMPDPIPRRSHGVHVPVSSSASSAFPRSTTRSASRFYPRTRLFVERFSRLQVFLYVQASEFARLPGRSHRCAYYRRAAEALTSGPNVLRCLRTHRIC